MELGERTITELRLELACEDERVDDAVCIIRNNARPRRLIAGWIFVTKITYADAGETEGK